jgi:hypothetical protein
MATTPHRWFLRLATVAIPLLAFAAVAGVGWDELYHRDPPSIAAQAIGQDWVTIVLAVPLLIAGVITARRMSVIGHVVALGVLAYAAYGYLLYSFGSRHNELFLVYVAILGVSIWGLVAGFVAISRRRTTVVRPQLAWRSIGAFFVAASVLFALIWLSEIVPALIRGQTPATVEKWGTPTNGVHVIDLAILLPILAWTGTRLWRRDGSVVIVAGVLLFKIATLGIAILAMGASEVLRGGAVDVGLVSVFVLLTATALTAAGHYLWAIRRAQTVRVVTRDPNAVRDPARQASVAVPMAGIEPASPM